MFRMAVLQLRHAARPHGRQDARRGGRRGNARTRQAAHARAERRGRGVAGWRRPPPCGDCTQPGGKPAFESRRGRRLRAVPADYRPPPSSLPNRRISASMRSGGITPLALHRTSWRIAENLMWPDGRKSIDRMPSSAHQAA